MRFVWFGRQDFFGGKQLMGQKNAEILSAALENIAIAEQVHHLVHSDLDVPMVPCNASFWHAWPRDHLWDASLLMIVLGYYWVHANGGTKKKTRVLHASMQNGAFLCIFAWDLARHLQSPKPSEKSQKVSQKELGTPRPRTPEKFRKKSEMSEKLSKSTIFFDVSDLFRNFLGVRGRGGPKLLSGDFSGFRGWAL